MRATPARARFGEHLDDRGRFERIVEFAIGQRSAPT
jgi:hypothetical protein